MGEAACDARLMTFLTCVRAVRDQTPGGFAAVKLTALGDPVLLSQITTCAHVGTLVNRGIEGTDFFSVAVFCVGERVGVTSSTLYVGYR